jgi:large subunit ribosomal protein L25
MTDTQQLHVHTRELQKKQVQSLRAQGIIPAVLYGHGKTNRNIQVEAKTFDKVYALAGSGSLIDLVIDSGQPIKAMVHDVSRAAVNNGVEHVDFYEVNMNETVTSEVHLIFQGESAAVKNLNGTLVKNKTTINIKCLPSQLIKELIVDISLLDTFEKSIRVQDIVFPTGIAVLDRADDSVVFVAEPRSDEELAALNEKVTEDVAKVEGVVKEAPAEVAAEGDKK